jgi:hypothetical protein
MPVYPLGAALARWPALAATPRPKVLFTAYFRFVGPFLSGRAGRGFQGLLFRFCDTPTTELWLVFAAPAAPLARPSSGFGLSINEFAIWESL